VFIAKVPATNVWWSAVCEDAFSIKKQSSSQTTYIKGGGAFGADDKVVQHNGAGTVSISDFVVEDFGCTAAVVTATACTRDTLLWMA
jgi:tRNA G37 N-methylase TrmD